MAALVISQALGLQPHVVGGAHGVWNRDRYDAGSEAVMNAAWPGVWVDAHGNRGRAIEQTYTRWQQTLSAGGDVWIAEGGQSDMTAAVVRLLNQRLSVNTRNRIHLVQHSQWNEDHADRTDLAYVKANTDYIRIEDGNHPNSTADLNNRNSQFVALARRSAQATA